MFNHTIVFKCYTCIGSREVSVIRVGVKPYIKLKSMFLAILITDIQGFLLLITEMQPSATSGKSNYFQSSYPKVSPITNW